MKPYMVLDRVTGAQMEVLARTPHSARDLAMRTWETQRIAHHIAKERVEVYEKLDPAEQARSAAASVERTLARSSLGWLSEDVLNLGGLHV